ncbi:hypothetical protein A2U01_0057143, partial [Trifolium medium]|nr:hypothetical protein [Trifolium medium]
FCPRGEEDYGAVSCPAVESVLEEDTSGECCRGKEEILTMQQLVGVPESGEYGATDLTC